jgi:hypothetical protein
VAATIVLLVAWYVIWHIRHGMWPWWGWPLLGLVIAACVGGVYLVRAYLRRGDQTQELVAALPGAIAVLEAQEDAKRLLRDGLDGTATITGVSGTGLFLDEDQEVVELRLEVWAGDQSSYAVVHRQPISARSSREYVPGATVRVKIDANYRDILTIIS